MKGLPSFLFQDIFGNLNDAVLSRASAEALVVDMKHNPAASTAASTVSGGVTGAGGGFPQIKTDMMYSHAAAAAAAGIPVSAGGSPGSGLGHSRLHQVRTKSFIYLGSKAACLQMSFNHFIPLTSLIAVNEPCSRIKALYFHLIPFPP